MTIFGAVKSNGEILNSGSGNWTVEKKQLLLLDLR